MGITNNRSVTFTVALIISALFLLATYHRSSVQSWWGAGPKPRYIFIDLGANRADSFEVFLKHPGAKFTYDFPRPEWATHEQAEVYLFEANPVFNSHLVQAREHYQELGMKINIFPSTVVDVKDGIRTFYLDTVNHVHDYWGSSIYSQHPDAIKSKSQGTDLTGINFSAWLLRNTSPRDFVVIKMDIEGAEYEVIPHMAEMSAWTVVDHLLVEWHGARVGGGTPQEMEYREKRAEAARKKLMDEGVNMPHYDSKKLDGPASTSAQEGQRGGGGMRELRAHAQLMFRAAALGLDEPVAAGSAEVVALHECILGGAEGGVIWWGFKVGNGIGKNRSRDSVHAGHGGQDGHDGKGDGNASAEHGDRVWKC
ncbi:hypothetical protein BGZ65_002127 [Modicella reniformis]|uniref:Methyltransferase FkbM domain-containing protein n=1 Tax=Modicella reniformis TaxID=1440133 RepID=A0A9P6M9N4_9FUNG|nr:hypothetical protein BGZ65_002127 [Modicella reniformis]